MNRKFTFLIFPLVFLCSVSFSQEKSKNLDEKVKTFLANHRGKWWDMNVPASDGKLLYDIIMKNGYTTVDIGPNQIRVWVSSQAPFRVQTSVAETVGVPPEKVRVFTPFIGGGFGGKKWNTQEKEAARLAK